MGDASPIGKDELRGLLEDVSNSAPSGARGTQAQLAAIEALDRLDAPPDSEAEKVLRLFDDRPDDELVAEDDWFPMPEWGTSICARRSASVGGGIAISSPE